MNRRSRAKPALGDLAHVIQHAMDVDRRAVERAFVGEHLHAVDQRHDAVHLLADELRQIAAGIVETRFEKLGGTPHPGEGVLHLMGQNGGKRSHCARRALAVDRLVQPAGDRALLQADDNPARPLDQRRQVGCDHAPAKGRTVHDHLPVGDIGPVGAGLFEQGEQRAIAGKEIAKRLAGCFHAQELGGGGIGVADDIVAIDGKDGRCQRLQQESGIDAGRRHQDKGRRRGTHHAASRSIKGR